MGGETGWSRAQVMEMLRRLAEADPEPRFELNWTNPYTLLVATVLAARNLDKVVNRATEKLFAVADTPEKMLKLGEEKLKEMIRSITFHATKAKNIIALSRILMERHGGQVPRDEAALTALPGVGRKTANIVRAVAFGEPVIPVDTHILRVARRLGLARARTPEAAQRELEALIPPEWRSRAFRWLVLHGRYVCTARKPKCEKCIICDLCHWEEKGPCPQEVGNGR